MIADWLLSVLRCPETSQPVERWQGGLRCANGARIDCIDDVPSLAFPADLSGQDGSWNRFYDRFAPFYDLSEKILGRLLTGIDIRKGRQEIVRLLPLHAGMRLLEVSPGPGVFLPMLRERVGHTAEICAIDLSRNMLRQCRARHANLNIGLVHGNAQHLPFADESFDALFHFGGINLFNDPQVALQEFVRVVRKGGVVAWGDEQMSDNFRHPVGRRVLPRMNPGFGRLPPSAPDCLVDVRRHEVYGGLGYFVVAMKPR